MAAVVADSKLDLTSCALSLGQSARLCAPLFLRIKKELDVTGTFKQRKIDLVKRASIPARSPTTLFQRPEAEGHPSARSGPAQEVVGGASGSDRCRPRRRTCLPSGARPGRSAGSRGYRVRSRDARAISRDPRGAAAGRLSAWEATAEGALALVIALDQFPRNMFRGIRAPSRPTRWRGRRAPRASARLRSQDADARAQLLLSAVQAQRESRRPGALRRALASDRRCRGGEMGRGSRST